MKIEIEMKLIFIKFFSIDTEDEREYRNPPDRLQLSGLQGFSLTYSVTWPVSLVLDRKAHFCYQMIFRHLFYCKYVERLLCRYELKEEILFYLDFFNICVQLMV